jgi:hypothetical protein
MRATSDRAGDLRQARNGTGQKQGESVGARAREARAAGME